MRDVSKQVEKGSSFSPEERLMRRKAVSISTNRSRRLHPRTTASRKDTYSYPVKKYLYVWLVDSETNELIRYEGKKNFDSLNRVLLIHSHYCERCVNNAQSCGNNTEKPKDPAPNATKTEWKFSMRFNQNCQTTSGNPTDKKKRKFRLLVSLSDCESDRGVDVAISSAIVVHNNSKKTKDMLVIENLLPEFGHPGSNLVITGRHFDKNVHVYVGGVPVSAIRLYNSTTLLHVILPDLGPSGPRSVVLKKKDRVTESPKPLKYYTLRDHACSPSIDCYFCRSMDIMAPMFLENGKKRHYQQLTDWESGSLNSTSWVEQPAANCGYHWAQSRVPQSGFSDQMHGPPPSSYLELVNGPSHQEQSKRIRYSSPLPPHPYQAHYQCPGPQLPYTPPDSESSSSSPIV
ncbi:transcription factor collier [Trichonephila clavata]|uniref:Transcription factor collier n=1 Tax=Trichonephila clavata TaxID=2740835 RepID=A0A8X6K7F8_TRICU|nr:transcription factor collier [Trichonephila clavata]